LPVYVRSIDHDRKERAVNRRRTIRAVAAAAAAVAAVSVTGAATAAPAASTTDHVALTIKSDTQHARKGPDGKWHDAYLPAAFTAKSGDTVVVTIRNYDPAPHTFTSKGLGLNVVIKKGSARHPSVTTFTFRAPKAGAYTWQCVAGCDPWAMTHLGFMEGRVTVTA
jgi:plastocyanin